MVAQAHLFFLFNFLRRSSARSGAEEGQANLWRRTWQTEINGDSFPSCQHLYSEPPPPVLFIFLHFNKLFSGLYATFQPHWHAAK